MHRINKNKNRKMYSEKLKRYVNLTEIPKFFMDSEEVRIIEKHSGKDITNVIISKLLSVISVDTNHAIDLIKNTCKKSTDIVS